MGLKISNHNKGQQRAAPLTSLTLLDRNISETDWLCVGGHSLGQLCTQQLDTLEETLNETSIGLAYLSMA